MLTKNQDLRPHEYAWLSVAQSKARGELHKSVICSSGVKCNFPSMRFFRSGKPKIVEFNQHVLPIINSKCFRCHQPDPMGGPIDCDLDLLQSLTYNVYDRLAYEVYPATPPPNPG